MAPTVEYEYMKRESTLAGWCGLNGAVKLALSFEPIEIIFKSNLFENSTYIVTQDVQRIIFITAISNLLVQGPSIPSIVRWVAKKK